ncbi:MAG: hypothetical protein PHD30_03065 [Paludibacter sp.]|nr:hypothetical protein [Paludibacter sp.]
MDSFGDYIYLIIILIAGISSILGKRKKMRKTETEHTEIPELPDLDDVIPEFTDYKKPENPIYHEVKIKETKIEIPTYDTVEDVSMMKAKRQVKLVKSFKELQPEEPESSILSEIELDNMDEVKKAVIYSTIFNRKY